MKQYITSVKIRELLQSHDGQFTMGIIECLMMNAYMMGREDEKTQNGLNEKQLQRKIKDAERRARKDAIRDMHAALEDMQ